MESTQVEKAFVFKIFAVSSGAYGTSVNTFYFTVHYQCACSSRDLEEWLV